MSENLSVHWLFNLAYFNAKKIKIHDIKIFDLNPGTPPLNYIECSSTLHIWTPRRQRWIGYSESRVTSSKNDLRGDEGVTVWHQVLTYFYLSGMVNILKSGNRMAWCHQFYRDQRSSTWLDCFLSAGKRLQAVPSNASVLQYGMLPTVRVKEKFSHAGNRTPATAVRAPYPNH